MTKFGVKTFMHACVPSGQTRFMHGIHSKFRCKIRAFLFCHGLVSLNFVGPKSAMVGT